MDFDRVLVAFAPVFGLAVYCATHIVAARCIRGRNPYPALAIGAAMGIVAAAAITLVACNQRGDSVVDTCALTAMNTVAALGFAFGYFNFVNLTIASLRIRVLEEIADAGGRLPRASLLDRYSSRSVADLRLARLVRGGHLIERHGRLYSGRLKFLIVARIFDFLRGCVFGAAYATALRRPSDIVNRTTP